LRTKHIKENQQYGNWTVLSVKTENNKFIEFTIKCNCGFEKTTSNPYNIINNKSVKCVNCANLDKRGNYNGLPIPFWNKIVKFSKRRKKSCCYFKRICRKYINKTKLQMCIIWIRYYSS
jgi:hypothetical protein